MNEFVLHEPRSASADDMSFVICRMFESRRRKNLHEMAWTCAYMPYTTELALDGLILRYGAMRRAANPTEAWLVIAVLCESVGGMQPFKTRKMFFLIRRKLKNIPEGFH